jgi:hypothetical protein
MRAPVQCTASLDPVTSELALTLKRWRLTTECERQCRAFSFFQHLLLKYNVLEGGSAAVVK